MRKGKNPQSEQNYNNNYSHQVVIPVFVPNSEGYFKDGLIVLKASLESLIKTSHSKTFITVVNNGSSKEVVNYLNNLYNKSQIQEVVHTNNIGKNRAIIKALKGHDFNLITIADADVFFLEGWQTETVKLFNAFPKAGVVGLVPQFKLYNRFCSNLILSNLFNKKLKFTNVENPKAIQHFYKSIDWDDNYNKNYLKKHLTITSKNNIDAVVGSGHFVATYKPEALNLNLDLETNSKLSPELDRELLDKPVLKVDGWRLTTANNYAYHMGNVFEKWMEDALLELNKNEEDILIYNTINTLKPINKVAYFFKNKVARKLFSNTFINKHFLKFKGLPKSMLKNY